MITTSRLLSVLGALPLLAAVTVTPAAAQSSGVLNACVGKNAGVLRLTDASQGCRAGETLISWNQQGPKGDPGAAGPQFALGASVRGDGSVEALSAPAGATLTVTRTAPGVYNLVVTGLGTACPLPTANAFHSPTPMYFGPGSCGGGTLSLPVNSGNGADVAFTLNVVSQGPAQAAARASRAVRDTTPLGQR